MAKKQIILKDAEPGLNPSSKELAEIIIERIGLAPRKKGSTDKIYKVLIELYERAKTASREKDPRKALMTVEEMAFFAGITRQTMYDYLKRWLLLNIIMKNSYLNEEKKVVIGYRLTGNTLEQAFEKAAIKIRGNVETTLKYTHELQRIIKNEKISKAQQAKEQD